MLEMGHAANKVGTGQVTFAARDSDFDNKKIKQGEILALENGKLTFTETDVSRAAFRLTKSLHKKDSAFVTLIHGEGITEEQANALAQNIRAKIGQQLEVTVIDGGQPVYYYIISVE